MTMPDGFIALGNTLLASWGFWIFLSLVVFSLIFKSSITAFLNRLTRLGAGKWGVEAQEPNPAQNPPTAIAESLTPKPEEKGDPRRTADELLSKLVRSEYMIEQDVNLRKGLSERGLEPGSPETYSVLTAFLASALAFGQFEQMYNILWTTQLELLNAANTREPVGLTVEQLREHYNRGAAARPEIYAKYPFEAYLGYLTQQGLLVASEPGRYRITVKGRSLLLYLVHEGKALTGRIY